MRDDREVGPDVPLRKAPDLYLGIVRGRRFVHNPRGRDALAVLSSMGARLLDAADGSTLERIARRLDVGPRVLQPELHLLLRNGFVLAEGVQAPPRPLPQRQLDLWVHVTNACNLDCPYCYIQKDAHSLSEDTAARLRASLLASVHQDGVRHVHLRFAGGEPMLRFRFIQRFFVETKEALRAAGAGLSAAILTNGTVVPAGAPAWVRDHRLSVSVSLDGLHAVQDAMRPQRGGGGSFDLVSKGLDRWLAGGVRPYMLATVSARNLAELPALTRFFIEHHLGFRYSLVRDLEGGESLLEPRGAGWRQGAPGLVRLTPRPPLPPRQRPMLDGEPLHRVQSVLAQCYDLIEGATPLRPSFRRTHRFCDLDMRRPIRRACGAGTSSAAVSDRGLLSSCQAALHHEGTAPLSASGLVDQMAGLHVGSGLDRAAPNDECRACRFRHSCAGGCPLLLLRRDGDANGRSPYCEVFRFVLPRILRISALEILLSAP